MHQKQVHKMNNRPVTGTDGTVWLQVSQSGGERRNGGDASKGRWARRPGSQPSGSETPWGRKRAGSNVEARQNQRQGPGGSPDSIPARFWGFVGSMPGSSN